MRRRNGILAVTLIELLVVMSIISLLAGMLGLVVPAAGRRMGEARTKACMQKLTSVLQMYYDDCNQYPDAINHNPQRVVDANGSTTVPRLEGAGTYPQTNRPTLTRPLYMKHFAENAEDDRQYSELVWTLGSTLKGWGRPQFFEVFQEKDTNFSAPKDAGKVNIDLASGGQLVDGWGYRVFYLPACAYRRGGSGTVMILKGGAKGPFQNTNSFQMYSAGQDLKTPLDSGNTAGTEADDITNWGSVID